LSVLTLAVFIPHPEVRTLLNDESTAVPATSTPAKCIIVSSPLTQVQTICYSVRITVYFQQYFSYIVTVSFIGGGNRIIPPICRKSLKTLSHNVVSSTPHHERNSNSSQR
jgi:hypothetical protein